MSIFDKAAEKRWNDALLSYSRRRKNGRNARKKSLLDNTETVLGVASRVDSSYNPNSGNFSSTVTYNYPVMRTTGVASSAIILGDFKVPNPHSYEVITHRYGRGFSYQSYIYEPTTNSSINGVAVGLAAFPNMSFPLVSRASLETLLLTKLLDKVRGADVSVDLMQWKQTRRLIAGSELNLHRQVSILERSTRKFTKFLEGRDFDLVSKKRRAFKGGGNTWLTWVYGIKPTMQTIYDAMMTFAGRIAEPDGFCQFEVRAGIPVNRTFLQTTGENRNYYIQSGVHAAKMKVVLDMTPSTVLALSRYSSLNPASLAWELLPWSFVADWFVNVGGYLQALEAAVLLGSRFHSGTITFLVHCKEARATHFDYVSPFGEHISGSGRGSSEILSFERKILTSLPTPIVPQLNVNLSSGRMLNAAALLTSFVKARS